MNKEEALDNGRLHNILLSGKSSKGNLKLSAFAGECLPWLLLVWRHTLKVGHSATQKINWMVRNVGLKGQGHSFHNLHCAQWIEWSGTLFLHYTTLRSEFFLHHTTLRSQWSNTGATYMHGNVQHLKRDTILPPLISLKQVSSRVCSKSYSYFNTNTSFSDLVSGCLSQTYWSFHYFLLLS